MEIRKFPKCYLYSKGFGPGWWLQPEPIPTLWSRLVPPTGTKGLFSPAQRAGSRGLWSRLVAPTGTKGEHWFRLEAPTGTNVLARCGGKFSPTSLAERAQHLFISCAAAQVLSSSLICRHYTCLPLSLPCWAYWACGPASWPMCRWVSSRMQAVWPIRRHFFIFFQYFFVF